MQTFRGHKKEASTVRWHPVHEGMFTSGGSDGSVMFWQVEWYLLHLLYHCLSCPSCTTFTCTSRLLHLLHLLQSS